MRELVANLRVWLASPAHRSFIPRDVHHPRVVVEELALTLRVVAAKYPELVPTVDGLIDDDPDGEAEEQHDAGKDAAKYSKIKLVSRNRLPSVAAYVDSRLARCATSSAKSIQPQAMLILSPMPLKSGWRWMADPELLFGTCLAILWSCKVRLKVQSWKLPVAGVADLPWALGNVNEKHKASLLEASSRRGKYEGKRWRSSKQHIHRAKALQTLRTVRIRYEDENAEVRERRIAAARALLAGSGVRYVWSDCNAWRDFTACCDVAAYC